MKTILASLPSKEHAEDVLSAAAPLARRVKGHLIGFHTLQTLTVYPDVMAHVPDEVYANFAASQKDASESIREVFEARVSGDTFASEWRTVATQSMTSSDRLVEVAQTSDLVIMTQADKTSDRSDQYHAQEHVIRQSGRPVLHVPAGYRGEGLGKSVVIGWSPTREAARAVHDALSLLDEGATVWIVTASEGGDMDYEGATDLAVALDRYDITAEVVHRTSTRSNVAETLKREAMERGADMIVTGAFGHSRLYDFVIGAVTNDLMRNATVPVLFSR